MMKALFVVPLALLTCIALVGLIKVRKKQHEKEVRQNKFQDIKLRVNNDVLNEYRNNMAEKQNMLEKAKSQRKTLEKEMVQLRENEGRIRKDADLCKEGEKSDVDKLAVLAMNLKNLKAQNEKEVTLWTTEITALKSTLAGRSSVCDFLKEQSSARKMCGDEEPKNANEDKSEGSKPKQEQPNAEAPKQEQPNAEAPKQEQPNAEAPKQEQPKAEAPKQEQPNAEAPKQEQPKAEAPKQEQPNAEAPKQEQPNAEAPKQEQPNAEAPKQEQPNAEAPKQEQPKAEAPKQEQPNAEAPKQEQPEQEQPKVEVPKQEQPKAEAPKQEQPKAEAPKQE